MKKIIYSLIITAALLGSTACNDILEQMPNNSISGSSMWTTEAQVDQGVIGVYYSLQRPINGSNIIGSNTKIGYYGFEVYGMSGDSRLAVNSLFSSGLTPANTRFTYHWQWFYDGIHRANAAIAYIPNVSMDEAKRARLTAECKILRAFFYSRLNSLYGNGGLGVPLYLEPVSPDECTKGQTPEAEVWAQVIQDLTDAINESNLPNNQIQGEGRVSKGTAYALRGKAYLTTGKYAEAASDFSKVSECGYGLYPDYKALFKEDQERCKEMILSVQYIQEPGYGTALQKFCAPFQCGAVDTGGCWTDVRISTPIVDKFEVIVDENTTKAFNWSDFIPEWDGLTPDERKVFFIRDTIFEGTPIHSSVSNIVKTELAKLTERAQALYLPAGNEERIKKVYANRDPRLNHSIMVPYSTMIGIDKSPSPTAAAEYVLRFPTSGKYYSSSASAENNLREGYLPSMTGNVNNTMFYMFRKFIGEGLEFKIREHNPIDEPILRYADVLLMWAEALVELNDLNGAMQKVKEVRDRAGVPTMSSSFASQSVAREFVRDERRREFVCEGLNFFDEMRWRTLKESKFDHGYPKSVWGTHIGDPVYQWIGDAFYTWPVPRTEIERNPNLTKTPGWEDRY